MTTGMNIRRLVIREIKVESENVVSLSMEDPEGRRLSPWQPGAHLDLHLETDTGATLIRQYSLCGVPDNATCYRVAVLLQQEGGRGGSRHIHENLRPGHEITVSEPRNKFEMDESPKYIFVAGGIGITPILPMIHEAEARGADWELHYGGRSRVSMAFLGELERFGNRIHVVIDKPLDLNVLLGRPTPDTHVYACGPNGLLQAVETFADRWPVGAIRLERFKAEDAIVSGVADRSVRLNCKSSGLEVTAAADEPLLDALEKAGIDVLSSCREGVCGTCEVAVIDGTPDHRDSILTAQEKDRGDVMMVCVSRALTDVLTLEL